MKKYYILSNVYALLLRTDTRMLDIPRITQITYTYMARLSDHVMY